MVNILAIIGVVLLITGICSFIRGKHSGENKIELLGFKINVSSPSLFLIAIGIILVLPTISSFINPPSPTKPDNYPNPAPLASPSPLPKQINSDMDAHYIQKDDFFVAEQPSNSVQLAKMIESPSADTKDAKFIIVSSGETMKTKFYLKTRIAEEKDLKLGTNVVFNIFNGIDGIRHPPVSRELASQFLSWEVGPICDLAELQNGFVMIRNWKVQPQALRIVENIEMLK